MPANLSQKEVERLQSLGRQIREIAELDIQEENRKLWRAVNDGKMIRPVILARDYPVVLLREGPDKIDPIIEDPYWRRKEMEMLLTIYEWNHLRCDRIVEPYINVQAVINDTNVGLRMSSYPAQWTEKAEDLAHSYTFERVLFNEQDVEEKIKMPVVTYDKEATMERYEQMCEIMDGIIDVKIFGIQNFRFAMFDDIFAWTTINQGMMDLVMNPDYLHAAADRYVKCFIHRAKQYEELGLLSSNNDSSLIGNGGYGYSNELAPPTESGIGAKLKDNWGVTQDQILTSVSPAMSKEFSFDHAVPWTELFARTYHGCCERLDHKVKELGTFKKLKKFSVSPFAKCQEAMEKMGTKYVVSFKPNSTYLNLDPPAFDLLKEELINVCKWAREYNNSVEIIMKTIITLNHEPQRLWKWCDLAADIVQNY